MAALLLTLTACCVILSRNSVLGYMQHFRCASRDYGQYAAVSNNLYIYAALTACTFFATNI